jgi:Cu(I)/Ag(I) efflux system membrane protein CusA/SilA
MYMLDYNLSIAVAVGMIALTGVAVEIGVVMLVYLNHALEHERSKGALTQEKVATAVINGALLRVRPIIMTVGATIVGLVPIMYGTGTGSIVMQRIAAPMVGGMVSATILALMLIPAIFYLRYRNSH